MDVTFPEFQPGPDDEFDCQPEAPAKEHVKEAADGEAVDG